MIHNITKLLPEMKRQGLELPTPLRRSVVLGKRLGVGVYLKDETVQPTGSFKVRPALAGFLANMEQAKERGVVAASSGNFAQAVAYWGKKFGIRTQIVMMKRTAPFKVKMTEHFGGEVIFCENSLDARIETLKNLQLKTGAVALQPFDSSETVAGDATLGLELAQQIQEDKASVLVPASGGGLAAGVTLALHSLKPEFRVFAVQPENNLSLLLSFENGVPTNTPAFESIADALVATRPGKIPFEILNKNGSGVLRPSEDGILEALRILWKDEGIPAEPGAAVAVAALLEGKLKYRPGEALICVITGKNVDPEWAKSQSLT